MEQGRIRPTGRQVCLEDLDGVNFATVFTARDFKLNGMDVGFFRVSSSMA